MEKFSNSDLIAIGLICAVCLIVIIWGISYLVATIEVRREMKSFYLKQKEFNNDIRNN